MTNVSQNKYIRSDGSGCRSIYTKIWEAFLNKFICEPRRDLSEEMSHIQN